MTSFQKAYAQQNASSVTWLNENIGLKIISSRLMKDSTLKSERSWKVSAHDMTSIFRLNGKTKECKGNNFEQKNLSLHLGKCFDHISANMMKN